MIGRLGGSGSNRELDRRTYADVDVEVDGD
jgi:hypothetical protein